MRKLGLALLFCLAACGGKAEPGNTAPAVVAPPPPPPATPRPTERPLHVVDVNGTRLAYRLSGDSGAPVVFVHGTLGDFRSWRGQENALSQVFHVMVYSRRYHYPNPQVADTNQPYSPKVHAEDLAGLLLTLDLAPAHIVGASYGAYTALALARAHPNLVRSIVLAEPPVLHLLTISEAGDAQRRAFSTNVLDVSRRAFANKDSVTALRAYYDGIYGRGAFDNLPAGARADVLAHSFEMRQEMLTSREQYMPPITCGELSRITTPVLIVRGENSPAVFQIISDELARCLLSDTTVVIPGAAHPPNVGNPAYFNQVVARFLVSH